jgi:hypothetical protein
MHRLRSRLLKVVATLSLLAATTWTADLEAQQQTTISGQVISPSGNVPSSAATITAKVEELETLPKTRSFQSIALFAPSVNSGELEGGWQVNGASGAENAFVVDGVNTTSLINGASRQNTVFEYIDQVRVQTTGFSAEEDGALGGVITALTKSGTNVWRHQAHYYFGGSPLNAAPVKRLVLDPSDDKATGYVQDDAPRDHRHQFGVSTGGPIITNRLFFFASLSARANRTTAKYLFSSGTDSGQIARNITGVHAFGKLNFASRRANASLSVLGLPVSATGSLPLYNGFGPNWTSTSKAANAANRHRGWTQDQATVAARFDVVIGDSTSLTVHGGLFHDRYSDKGIPKVASYTYQTIASGPMALPAHIQGPVGTQNTPPIPITRFDTTSRRSANVHYTRHFGRNTLKGGFGYQHTLSHVDTHYPGGYVDIFWGRPAVIPGQSLDTGQYGYYTVNDRGEFGKAGANILSLFVQHELQAGDRVTLKIGVRAENEKVPSYRTGFRPYVFEFGFQDRIAPRLAVSYRIPGEKAATAYATFGRYVDWTKYQIARGLFGGDFWCVHYRSIDDPQAPLMASLNNMPGRDLWRGAGNCRDRRTTRFDIIDNGVKPVSQDSFSAGIDFQVGAHIAVKARYVHNTLTQTIEDVIASINGEAVYMITNPGRNSSKLMAALAAPQTGGGSFPMPEPKRQYDAVELGVSRRFANNWFGTANLTISRLYGNYAGLASSDEIRTPTTGVSSATAQQQAGSIFREGGNVNRGWDLDDAMFDSHGNLDVLGRLATDRPVVAKFYGGYNIFQNTQIGAFIYVGSGTPMSTYVNSVNQTELFVEGRGDMGRTPVYNKTDLLVSHELPMAGNKRLRLELNVLNLFNQKTARHVFNYLNRGAGAARASSAINLANVDLFKGYDYNAMIRATSDGANAFDPRFGMDDLFEAGTQGQVSVKFLF